jgi:hypothetical protein
MANFPVPAFGLSPRLIIDADLVPIVGALSPSGFGSPLLVIANTFTRGAAGFAGAASLVACPSPGLETSIADFEPAPNGNFAANLPGSLASGLTETEAAGSDVMAVGEGVGEEEVGEEEVGVGEKVREVAWEGVGENVREEAGEGAEGLSEAGETGAGEEGAEKDLILARGLGLLSFG